MSVAQVDADLDPLEPTLQPILEQTSLRWIFVGGKGGVGKTTTSCSLAIQLSKVRESVLLISTDPAHNLSDAFNQKFGKEARKVDGFDNLSAMEIDPSGSIQELLESADGAGAAGNPLGGVMQDIAFSIPGVDEAMSFAEVLKQVKSLSYSVIIFDTAPTGHTLRFLQFPTVLEKALGKISQLSGRFGPMLNGILGAQGAPQMEEMMQKMESMREVIGEVSKQFKDAELTTFVCVCIAEFLSLYETERMIQELNSYHIDTHSIVVNQLLFPTQGSTCDYCNARRKMQKKYLEQIEELYEDFNVVKIPMLTEEVRGGEKLRNFSEMLVKPFEPPAEN
ncbi:anion-transporting ATPase-like domain-containing protein [Pyronema domesticum]|uniref:Similar to ATPase get3 acc. no. A7EHP6 n=1 Tax=Pyronema omphalodes (strain CBS 100304) TaxID=1076935 RepID=U4L0K0_PYROM|nr:anion-transporting ATPase-like domain-containing protein [Pyronema domesticum]CCX08273.1 Similar to ATPase get3; acc. no. A7EHP6 [Pyronema omphalodes CBS 100304]